MEMLEDIPISFKLQIIRVNGFLNGDLQVDQTRKNAALHKAEKNSRDKQPAKTLHHASTRGYNGPS